MMSTNVGTCNRRRMSPRHGPVAFVCKKLFSRTNLDSDLFGRVLWCVGKVEDHSFVTITT